MLCFTDEISHAMMMLGGRLAGGGGRAIVVRRVQDLLCRTACGHNYCMEVQVSNCLVDFVKCCAMSDHHSPGIKCDSHRAPLKGH